MKKIALIVLFSLIFAQASFAIVDPDNGIALRVTGHVAKGTAAKLQSDDVGAAKEFSEAAQEISSSVKEIVLEAVMGKGGCFGFQSGTRNFAITTGLLNGAATGALIGNYLPVVGTVVGAITGGIIGWLWKN